MQFTASLCPLRIVRGAAAAPATTTVNAQQRTSATTAATPGVQAHPPHMFNALATRAWDGERGGRRPVPDTATIAPHGSGQAHRRATRDATGLTPNAPQNKPKTCQVVCKPRGGQPRQALPQGRRGQRGPTSTSHNHIDSTTLATVRSLSGARDSTTHRRKHLQNSVNEMTHQRCRRPPA
jgi:hypothetical protein